MRRIVCASFGPPEDLIVEDAPAPTPGPGQALVRHRAWGLNYVDVLMVAGGYQLKPDLPFTPGLEAAGVVEALGEGVTDLAIGDAVTSAGRFGLFAELAAVDRAQIQALPRGFDFAEGAAFRSAYMTAWNALVHGARLQPGETVLILGAAGGVGLAAVEVARALGAIAVAAAGSAEKRAALTDIADHVIDPADGLRDPVKAVTEGRGADVIYDPVGGAATEAALRAMNYGCRLLAIGFAGGPPASVPTNKLLIKGASVIGFRAGEIGRRNPGLNERTMRDLTRLAEAGRLRPRISHRTAWPNVAEAMRPIQERTVIGKSVMVAE